MISPQVKQPIGCALYAFGIDAVGVNLAQNYVLLFGGSLFVGSALLEQCNVNIVLGHRSREAMRSLISSLKGIINTFLNGQLVPQETEFLDFLSCSLRAT